MSTQKPDHEPEPKPNLALPPPLVHQEESKNPISAVRPNQLQKSDAEGLWTRSSGPRSINPEVHRLVDSSIATWQVSQAVCL